MHLLIADKNKAGKEQHITIPEDVIVVKPSIILLYISSYKIIINIKENILPPVMNRDNENWNAYK